MNRAIGLFIGFGIVGLLLWKLLQRQTSGQKGDRAHQLGHVDRTLQRRLMQMLQGNQEIANRLLVQVRNQHPGKAEHWYWEKVVFDLERDRR